jgi:hypothetical protein
MIAVGLLRGDRPKQATIADDAPARESRAAPAREPLAPDFDAGVFRSAHLLELLRDAHRELADDVMLRAARITATTPQHAAILSRLEQAIETTRQLALDQCRPPSAGPYLRQRIAAGWEHAPQSTRKAALAPASQIGVKVPL